MRVYDYDVDGSRHCREGVATEEHGALLDTFWRSGGDRHRLTDSERKSARLRFDTDEFELVQERYRKGVPEAWSDRAPEDRQTVTSQHGLETAYYIRIDSEPDHATRVANAEAALKTATSALSRAVSAVELAAIELARVEADR